MAKRKEETALAVRGPSTLSTWEADLARDAVEAAQVETVGASRLSTQGGVFSVAGNPLKDKVIAVVVLAASFENVYYEGSFDSENPQAPVCFAFGKDSGLLVRHEKSAKPQAENCATCQHNAFGSAERGRGKACKNAKRMVVISAEGLSPESIRDGEPLLFSVPVTSVKAWAAYVKGLAGMPPRPRPPYAVVTEIEITSTPTQQAKYHIGFRLREVMASEELIRAAQARRAQVEDMLVVPYVAPSDEPKAPGRKASGRPAREKF